MAAPNLQPTAAQLAERWFGSNRIEEGPREQIEDACRRCGFDVADMVLRGAELGATTAGDMLTFISGAWTAKVDGDEFSRRAPEFAKYPPATKDDLRELVDRYSIRPAAAMRLYRFEGKKLPVELIRLCFQRRIDAGWDLSAWVEGIPGVGWEAFLAAARRS